MSQSDLIGPEPVLAEDGLCANTECTKRGSNECPVFRLQESLAIPKTVSNVINFPKSNRNQVGFSMDEYSIRNIEDVTIINLEEERFWREILKILEMQDQSRKGMTGWEIKMN